MGEGASLQLANRQIGRVGAAFWYRGGRSHEGVDDPAAVTGEPGREVGRG
ncbi:hypothetical protein PAA8504_03836 [Palleronia abyssalis]|uniref:Uncharacterized protein n=1 Tax=Palleronia abyssalis TaxID=1501240 RepID=A0A2R8C0R0_9RHOB|nr:hypothetical protein PAA8504_03836 [Palleronia abyssalis]